MSVIAIVVLTLAAVAAVVWAMAERGRADRAELTSQLLQDQAAAGAEIIKAQAAASAALVADALVKRAAETFQNQERLAQARIEAQLKPVAETLAKFQTQVEAAEKARAETSGGLKAQIEQLLAASMATQDEARKLSGALKRGAGVQGRWGEQMLRNVLEMAGLKANVDFKEQITVQSLGEVLRPDVTVRLPGGGVFVIDAKCSLTAFMEAQEALDDAARDSGQARHAQSVRSHMQSLAAKAYWDQFANAPDFVAMFVPGDGFLAAAVERLPELYTEAMDRRVILVTPSSLFALCKAVAYGWRVEEQHLNAKEIALLGRDLYKRLSVMGGHVTSLGRHLTGAVKGYNDFVGSLEGQVLTQARRFETLKVDNLSVELTEIKGLDAAVRPLAKLSSEANGPVPVLTIGDATPTSAA